MFKKNLLCILLAALITMTICPVCKAKAATSLKTQNYLAAGPMNNFILKPDGTVWRLVSEELKNGTYSNKLITVKSLNHIVSISCGGHQLALKNDGTVWAWGCNYNGQLGDGTTKNSTDPFQIKGLDSIKQIYAGDAYSLALKDDGTVYSWGCNYNGQLGIGTKDVVKVPTKIQSLSNVKAVAAGAFSAMALKNDGTVWAWGNLPDKGESSTPVKVKELTDIVGIDSQSDNNIVLKKDGTIYTWKYKYQVKTYKFDNVKTVIAGREDFYFIKTDGTLYSFNEYTKTPQKAGNLKNVAEIACGSYDELEGFTPGHIVILLQDGSIYQKGEIMGRIYATLHKVDGVKIELGKEPSAIQIKLNNSVIKFSLQPLLSGNAVMADAKSLSKALGAAYTYDSKKNTVTIRKNKVVLIYTIGSKAVLVSGKKVNLEAAAIKSGSVPFVDVKSLAQSLGYKYKYDSGTRVVTINK